jgi:hypothetical protein
MKSLKDHTIIYDDDCAMCDLYTGSFVRSGMLDTAGRRPYTKAGELLQDIDRERACDEIALVNVRTGEVTYGIDSLMRVISNAFPFFKPLFANAAFYWTMKKMYAFISYNRKVIVPAPAKAEGPGCHPTFNAPYRIAYILVTWILTSVILNGYSHVIGPFLPAGSFYREFFVCGGQIIFQGFVIFLIHKNQLLNYLGNLMTISFAGALALSIPLAFAAWISSPLIFTLWFVAVVGPMLLEHMRRIRLLALHPALTFSWVCYRLIVLLLLTGL